VKWKQEYFFEEDWTGRNSLIPKKNFSFTRNACGPGFRCGEVRPGAVEPGGELVRAGWGAPAIFGFA
jgi:hypothetical protein